MRRFLLALFLAGSCASALAVVAPAHTQLLLEIVINGESTGIVLPVQITADGLQANVSDLRQAGVTVPPNTGSDVLLSSLIDHTTRYDEAKQQLIIERRRPQNTVHVLGLDSVLTPDFSPNATGAIVNYQTSALLGPAQTWFGFAEGRLLLPAGVFKSEHIIESSGGRRRHVRLATAFEIVYADKQEVRVFGDLLSSSLSFTRPVRIAGVQVRRDFSLRPDLVTYPVDRLFGVAQTEGTVELDINGTRQLLGRVPAGPFVMPHARLPAGASQLAIIVRDRAGVEQVVSIPTYLDTRLLRSGLSEYSFEAGRLREQFGRHSNSYGSLVGSGSFRHGSSDHVTIQGHFEVAKGLGNVTAATLIRMGTAGVVSMQAGMSRRDETGSLLGAGYRYVSGRLSADFETILRRRFEDLADLSGSFGVEQSDRASLNLATSRGATVGVSYFAFKVAGQSDTRVASLTANMSIRNRLHLSMSAYRDAAKREHGLHVNLAGNFGRVATNVGLMRQGGRSQVAVQASRSAEVDGGVSWTFQGVREGEQATQAHLQAMYEGRYGEVGGMLLHRRDANEVLLHGAGAVSFLNGSASASRRLDNAFAIVHTGLPSVPIYHDNRLVGHTNQAGKLLVPNLNSYSPNRIAIDTDALPHDVAISSTAKTVTPRRYGAAAVSFDITRRRSLTMKLVTPQRTALPPGLVVQVDGTLISTVTGYDGMVYLETLDGVRRLTVGNPGSQCYVELNATAVRDDHIEEVICEG